VQRVEQPPLAFQARKRGVVDLCAGQGGSHENSFVMVETVNGSLTFYLQ
jgi:hypothetical protein